MPTSASRPASSSRTSSPDSAADRRWWRRVWPGSKTVMTLHDVQRIGHPLATWGVTEGNPGPRRRARDRADGAGALRRGRDAQPRAEDHGRVRRRHLRRASRGLRACQGHGDASGPGAVRSRADDELRLPARSEPVSGGQRHVGGGEDREDRRHDHLRRRVPRRASVARIVRRSARVGSVAREAARDDFSTRVLGAGPVAGPGAGADSDQGRRARQDRWPAPGAGSRRPLHAD